MNVNNELQKVNFNNHSLGKVSHTNRHVQLMPLIHTFCRPRREDVRSFDNRDNQLEAFNPTRELRNTQQQPKPETTNICTRTHTNARARDVCMYAMYVDYV